MLNRCYPLPESAMTLPAEALKMTTREFLEWEAQQPQKYELHRGEVFPHEIYSMVGARRKHATVTLNIASALKVQLRGTPCRAFVSDIKLEVTEDSTFYPDIMVTCDAGDLTAEIVMHNPKVIIEVLSPSTASYDRGDKFCLYRQLPDLAEYALVDPERQTIEVYRRQAGGDWLLALSDSVRGLVLNSLDFVLPPAVLFEDL